MKSRFLIVTFVIFGIGYLGNSRDLAGQGPDYQGPPPQQQSAVGRLSLVQGHVSTAHGDAGEWMAGTINTPLVPGDRVATADRSRVEIQLDPANVMRLDERTEVKLADLQPNKMQVQLASGLANFSVLTGAQADVEIDTPNMGVHPLSPGIYRIQVNSDSETQLIVYQGEAEVLTNQGTTKVESGQMIQIHGTDDPEYRLDRAPGTDDFDRWSGDRDRQIASVQTSQHSDPQYTGSSDLDAYGQWSEVPDQGWCWTPQVDAGWAPYTVGHWGWEPMWGWTWIGGEPWGWAPYHYGSWFMLGGRWHWRPDAAWGRGGALRGGHWGGGAHFLPGGGPVNGRSHAYTPGLGPRSNYVSPGRGVGPATSFRSSFDWNGRTSAAPGSQYNWARFANPRPLGAGAGYSSAPRGFVGGGYAGRVGGWNAPAPRAGGSYYGGVSRPALDLNRPIMRQRAPATNYYGGGRTYSAPSGGHSYSAQHSSGGSGGGHSSGGGGGHSSGSGRR